MGNSQSRPPHPAVLEEAVTPIKQLLLVTFSEYPLLYDLEQLSLSHDSSLVLIKLVKEETHLDVFKDNQIAEINAWNEANQESSNALLVYDEERKKWQLYGRKEGEFLVVKHEIARWSYLDRQLQEIASVIDWSNSGNWSGRLLDGVLMYLGQIRISLYNPNCEVKVVELNAGDCGLCLSHLSFPQVGSDPVMLLEGAEASAQQLHNVIGERVPIVIRLVNQVVAAAKEVRIESSEEKLHQALGRLINIHGQEYRQVYLSIFYVGETGVYWLYRDLIDLALKADVEFSIVFFAVRAILEMTAERSFNRDVLPPAIWGASGSKVWWDNDFLRGREGKLVHYLNSLEATDIITRGNIVVIAEIALSLLCQKLRSIKPEAPAFQLFEYENNLTILLSSYEFIVLFNRVVSQSLSIFVAADIPRAIFLIVRHAYAISIELVNHEPILLQILNSEYWLTSFMGVIPKICADIVKCGFVKAAQSVLSLRDKDKLSLSPEMASCLITVAGRDICEVVSNGVLLVESRTSFLRRQSAQVRACEFARRLVDDSIRSRIRVHRKNDAVVDPVLSLCQRVVCASDLENRRRLEASMTRKWDEVKLKKNRRKDMRFFSSWSMTAISEQEEKRNAQLTKGLMEMCVKDVSKDDPTARFQTAWSRLMFILQCPVIVLEGSDMCVRCFDYVVQTDSDIESDVGKIRGIADSEKRPVLVLVNEEFKQYSAASDRILRLIVECGEYAFIVWPHGWSALDHSVYSEPYSQKNHFPKPLFVFLGEKNDLCESWAFSVEQDLAKRFACGISITQTYFEFVFDRHCIQADALPRGVSAVRSRSFLRQWPVSERVEMLENMLGRVKDSEDYKDSVRCDFDVTARLEILRIVAPEMRFP